MALRQQAHASAIHRTSLSELSKEFGQFRNEQACRILCREMPAMGMNRIMTDIIHSLKRAARNGRDQVVRKQHETRRNRDPRSRGDDAFMQKTI